MKKLSIFLLIAWFHLTAVSQNVVLLEYFIDTDAGFGHNTVVNVSPAADDDFPFLVNLTGVSLGFHKLYIRTRDSNGKWSQTTRRNIEVIPALTDKNIVAAEYFFDADPGVGSATPFTVSPQAMQVTQDFIAITSSLTPGFHKLYIRTKDAHGKWSITLRRTVEVPFPESISITSGEYFFDADPGVGSATPITISPQGIQVTEDFIASTATLTPGYHKLYIRTVNEQGKWSLTSRRTVDVPYPESMNVVGGEYFFDADPGVGHASPIVVSPQGIQVTEDFMAATAALTIGYHKLYMRTVNEQGKWSLTSRRNVQVIQTDGNINVTGVEYFFGTDPGVSHAPYFTFSNPQPDGTFTLNIPQNQVPNERDTLYLRIKDSPNQQWSLTKLVSKNFITTNCGENVWIGMVSTDWHNPANWSCGTIPLITTDVIINSDTPYSCEVLTGSSAVCRKITAVPGSNVKVNTSAILTIAGD